MSNNENFLKAYKELENNILNLKGVSQEDSPVFWYENQIKDTEKQNKLRLCRTGRNFLQHNDNGNFFEASEGMIVFLNKLAEEVSANYENCGDMMIKATNGKTVIDSKTKIIDCLKNLEKNSVLLVCEDNKVKGLFTPLNYLKISNKTKIGKTSKIEKFYSSVKEAYCKKTDTYTEALKLLNDGYDVVIVSDTGKKNGKILGYIIH